jgi:hypothetical protein
MPSRSLSVDIRYALAIRPAVAAVWALDVPSADQSAYHFAIELSPYSILELVAAHYAIVDGTDRDAFPSVLYFNAEFRPPFIDRFGHLVRIDDTERFAARRRAQIRAVERRLDAERRAEDVARMELVLAEIARTSKLADVVAVSRDSGVFEVVPDPFPSPKVAPRRLLVIDDHESTREAVESLTGVEVTWAEDVWGALESIRREPFDLVLCALAIEGQSGRELYRIATAERPEIAPRFVFVASPTAVAGLPPGSTRGRVLARPVEAEAIRGLMEKLIGKEI